MTNRIQLSPETVIEHLARYANSEGKELYVCDARCGNLTANSNAFPTVEEAIASALKNLQTKKQGGKLTTFQYDIELLRSVLNNCAVVLHNCEGLLISEPDKAAMPEHKQFIDEGLKALSRLEQSARAP